MQSWIKKEWLDDILNAYFDVLDNYATEDVGDTYSRAYDAADKTAVEIVLKWAGVSQTSDLSDDDFAMIDELTAAAEEYFCSVEDDSDLDVDYDADVDGETDLFPELEVDLEF